MSDSAQLFTGVHDTPAYTRLFNRSTRIWVAAPVVLGGVGTPVLAAVNLDSGHADKVSNLQPGDVVEGCVVVGRGVNAQLCENGE